MGLFVLYELKQVAGAITRSLEKEQDKKDQEKREKLRKGSIDAEFKVIEDQ